MISCLFFFSNYSLFRYSTFLETEWNIFGTEHYSGYMFFGAIYLLQNLYLLSDVYATILLTHLYLIR